jgi:ATP-dependent Lon protease
MTGVTLRGRSVACRWNQGEKILGSKRANIKEIILCHENKKWYWRNKTRIYSRGHHNVMLKEMSDGNFAIAIQG